MLLAHLPMLFSRRTRARPRDRARLGDHRRLRDAATASSAGDVVEISRGVLQSDALFEQRQPRRPHDPRVPVWQEDGRTFMRTRPWTYDAIISEPSNPWIAGIGGPLHARMLRGGPRAPRAGRRPVRVVPRVRAGGRLDPPRAAHGRKVFPHATVFQVLLDGDVIVLASDSPLEPDFARMEQRFERPELRRDLARMRAYNLATLCVFHAIPESEFARVAGEGPINTDDHQRLESMAAKAFFRNGVSRLVWLNHCLNRAPGTPGNGLLDRYVAWREAQGDPLSKEELEGALRRVQASLDPQAGRPLIEALAARAARAHPRAAPAKLVARGAVPDLATLEPIEASDRGADLFAGGDTESAIACWRRAIEVDPKHQIAYANLAAGLQKKGDLAGAARALEEGIAASPTSAFLTAIEAQLYEQAGDRARAQVLYEKVVQLDPRHLVGLTSLGRILFETNQPARAADCFERALAIDPTSWQHAADLAQILTQVPGGRPRAVQVLQGALAYHPDEPELLRVLGMVQGHP
jgi:tetratricopeptide (TPR) repeat protein